MSPAGGESDRRNADIAIDLGIWNRQVQAKMQEYRNNGVRLGWLSNPQDQQVEIYRLGQVVEILQSPH